jgi:glycosyltransferase involved in cell wall biosynthesis
MSVGCPVISFARGAAPEIVVHGKTGFLVQNVDEMVQSIARIDEIDRETTRLHVEHNFSAPVMVEKYIDIYKKVIAMSKTAERDKVL